jgi:hypothetical protein
LSKRKGAARKRRKAAKARQRRDRTPQALLTALAEVLNRCEANGVRVRFRHGAAYCHFGVVLPPEGKSGGWDARVFRAVPMSPPEDGEDD